MKAYVRTLAFIAAAFGSADHNARAADAAYPAKPVRVLVGLATGGATDTQARWYAQRLSAGLGKTFVVDNRSGAGGLIAYQAAISAAPDGYTLLVVTPGLTIAPALHKNSTVDPTRQLAPISLLTKAPYILVVQPAFAAATMKDFIAYGKAKPNALTIGAPVGTSIYMGVVWIQHATKSAYTIVSYKGAGPAVTDVLAGQINATISNVLTAVPLIKAGRLRGLAVTSLERSTALPELPTVAESGVPGYDVTTWHGWAAPRGTPPAIVKRLRDALAEAASAPDIAARLAEDGAVGVGSSPEAFGKLLADEMRRWSQLVRETGVGADRAP